MSQHDDQNDAAYMAALERENAELKKELDRLRAKVDEPAQGDQLVYTQGADRARVRYGVSNTEAITATGSGVTAATERARAHYAKTPTFRDGAGSYVTFN